MQSSDVPGHFPLGGRDVLTKWPTIVTKKQKGSLKVLWTTPLQHDWHLTNLLADLKTSGGITSTPPLAHSRCLCNGGGGPACAFLHGDPICNSSRLSSYLHIFCLLTYQCSSGCPILFVSSFSVYISILLSYIVYKVLIFLFLITFRQDKLVQKRTNGFVLAAASRLHCWSHS